jgi:hypothetical protein
VRYLSAMSRFSNHRLARHRSVLVSHIFRGLPILLVATACNDPATAPVPVSLVVVQAPSSVGAPGFALADTLKVRLADEAGHPRRGATVTWAVRSGGGSVAPVSDTTDANGIAAAIWTLGGTPGPNELRASGPDDSSVTFRATGDVFHVDRLASDWRLACGLVSGDLWCWGRYFWGNSPPASIYENRWDNFSPGLVDDAHDFVDLAVSAWFVCALDQAGAVWCASETEPQVAQVPGLPPIRGLVGRGWGPTRFCGIAVADSTAWCWWSGAGSPVAPAQVPGSPAFVRLWSDFRTSCGLLADSTAACWGTGPLGNGSEDSSSTPVAVNGGHKFVELGVGDAFACGRTAASDLWCWGRAYGIPHPPILEPDLTLLRPQAIGLESYYLMGVGAVSGLSRWSGASLVPDPAAGLSGVAVERFPDNGNSCVLSAGGGVYCSEEMWNGWTGVYYEIYHPVPPVRTFAPTASGR